MIHHTALVTTDMLKMEDFLQTVFGMKKVVEGERPIQKVKFLSMADERGNRIELIQPEEPDARKRMHELTSLGLNHIGMAVENMEEVMAKALATGATEVWPMQKGITVKRIAFIAAPDGTLFELIEPL